MKEQFKRFYLFNIFLSSCPLIQDKDLAPLRPARFWTMGNSVSHPGLSPAGGTEIHFEQTGRDRTDGAQPCLKSPDPSPFMFSLIFMVKKSALIRVNPCLKNPINPVIRSKENPVHPVKKSSVAHGGAPWFTGGS